MTPTNGLGPSLVRTLVPILIGPLVAYFGVNPDDPGLLLVVSGIASYLYYVLVRLCETKYPSLGYLLGIAKAPAYSPAPQPQGEPVVVPDSSETPVQTDNTPKDGDETAAEQGEEFTGEMR